LIEPGFVITENGSAVRSEPSDGLDVAARGISMSADGRWVVSASGGEGTLWNTSTMMSARTWSDADLVALSRDGKLLVHTVSTHILADPVSNGLRVFDVDTGVTPLALAVSPSGTLAVLGNNDNTGDLRRTNDGSRVAQLWSLAGHSGAVTTVAFAPDGQSVATGSDDQTIVLWNTTTGALIRKLSGAAGGITAITFTSDGSRLVSADKNGDLRVWSTSDGTTVATHHVSKPPGDVKLSPDDTVAYIGGDVQVRRLQLSDWSSLPSLPGHTGAVSSLALPGDGRLIVSGSVDGTLRIHCLP
jgi:WD40 repeat protein